MKYIRKYKKIIILGVLAIILMGIISFLLYEPMLIMIEQMKTTISTYGLWGGIFIVLLMTLQVIFVFLPGEVIEVLSGYLYGPLMGMIFCLIGAAIGGYLIYMIVNKYKMKWVQRWIKEENRKDLECLKQCTHLNWIIFLIFFIPGTPKDLITYIVPFTEMKLSSFLMITSIARIPSVITSTVGGNALGLKEYEFTLLVFGITGILSLMGMCFYKHKMNFFHHSNKNL